MLCSYYFVCRKSEAFKGYKKGYNFNAYKQPIYIKCVKFKNPQSGKIQK